MYRTVVLGYHSKAKKMATSIEECANLMADQGYDLVTFSLTGSGKAILLFKDNTPYTPKKKSKKSVKEDKREEKQSNKKDKEKSKEKKEQESSKIERIIWDEAKTEDTPAPDKENTEEEKQDAAESSTKIEIQ